MGARSEWRSSAQASWGKAWPTSSCTACRGCVSWPWPIGAASELQRRFATRACPPTGSSPTSAPWRTSFERGSGGDRGSNAALRLGARRRARRRHGVRRIRRTCRSGGVCQRQARRAPQRGARRHDRTDSPDVCRPARSDAFGLRRRRAGVTDESLSLGCRSRPHPACRVECQGAPGSLSQPHDAAGLRRAVGPEPRDGHLLRRRLEDQLRAGDRGECDRLQGPGARNVPWTSVRRLDHGHPRALGSGATPRARRRRRLHRRSARSEDHRPGRARRSQAAPLPRAVQARAGPALPLLGSLSPRALRGAERHRPGRPLRRQRCTSACRPGRRGLRGC